MDKRLVFGHSDDLIDKFIDVDSGTFFLDMDLRNASISIISLGCDGWGRDLGTTGLTQLATRPARYLGAFASVYSGGL